MQYNNWPSNCKETHKNETRGEAMGRVNGGGRDQGLEGQVDCR